MSQFVTSCGVVECAGNNPHLRVVVEILKLHFTVTLVKHSRNGALSFFGWLSLSKSPLLSVESYIQRLIESQCSTETTTGMYMYGGRLYETFEWLTVSQDLKYVHTVVPR